MPSIDDILQSYPRQRPPLSPGHEALYVEEYAINRGGKGLLYGLVSLLESWMHRQIAHKKGSSGPVLELGCGGLNHLAFEDPTPQEYDGVEPLTYLCKESEHFPKLGTLYGDYEKLADLIGHKSYQRIISTAVLEHLESLPRILASCGLLLQEGGRLQAGIPSEGGLLWGLSWRLSTGIAYRLRTGLDYKTVMRHEHINNAREIEAILRYLFAEVRVNRFPLPALQLSMYSYVEASSPNLDRCREISLSQSD